jgi:hypothetical protein
MAGHSQSKTGVNALMPGHPRLACFAKSKKDVDARVKPAHDEGETLLFLGERRESLRQSAER